MYCSIEQGRPGKPAGGKRHARDAGQATIEAAVMVPVFLLVVAVLCQPAILAYDRMVMDAAAAQGVRMLATRPADAPDAAYRQAIEDQLQAIPAVGVFRSGDAPCEIELSGNEDSDRVSVGITLHVDPLPLVGTTAALFAATDSRGRFVLEVACSQRPRPPWAQGSPSSWTTQWN